MAGRPIAPNLVKRIPEIGVYYSKGVPYGKPGTSSTFSKLLSLLGSTVRVLYYCTICKSGVYTSVVEYPLSPGDVAVGAK